MEISAIPEFREPVRFLLGDHREPYSYTDAAIDRATRCCVKFGLISGVSLSADSASIQPPITDPNQYLLLSLEAAWRFVGAEPDRVSYRTRAYSEATGGKSGHVFDLHAQIVTLREGGMFESWTSFGSWLTGVGGMSGVSLWNHLSRVNVQQPFDTFTVSVSGITPS